VRAESELRWAQDPRVTLELALLKAAQLRRLMPLAELTKRLEAVEGGVAPPPAARPMPAERTTTVRSRAPAPERAANPQRARRRTEADEADGAAPPAAPQSEGGIIEQIMALAASRPSLVQPLRTATARLRQDELVLTVAKDFRAFAEMHADEYRDLARQALGRAVTVKLDAAHEEEAPTVPSSVEDVRRQELMERARQEPAVQQALEMFDGRIADVREDRAPKKR
jgi:DNA polymerase III gamma/tau subunit